MTNQGFMNSKIAMRIKITVAVILAAISVFLLISSGVEVGRGVKQPVSEGYTVTLPRSTWEEEPDEDLKR